MTAARLMLVDDHAIVREGYRSLLQKQPRLTVVAEASDGAEAYRLFKQTRPDLVIMDDGDHGDALAFLLRDEIDHHGAIGRIERSGRFIQQQDRQIGDETAGDIDALLFAARERRWRQRPQRLGDVEAA